MFSVLASTRPTALTVRRKSAVGGADGGAVGLRTDRHFQTDTPPKLIATSASAGKPRFFIVSPSSHTLHPKPLRRDCHFSSPIQPLRFARRPSAQWCRRSRR